MIVRRAALAAAAAAMVLGQLAHAQATAPQAPQTTPLPPVTGSGTPANPVVVTAGPYQPQDKDERGLWMEMDEQERDLKNSNFVIRDPDLNAYIHRVFCKVVGPRCSEVRIYLTRTAYFNANIAPNGMMQVWSGLLLRTHNEAQLAAVLAHEYTHYQNRHSLMLFRQIRARAAGAAWLSMFGLIGALIALGQISAIFKFSRDQEAEADLKSVAMIEAAGYDPREVPKIWEQFRAEADATADARGTKSRKDKNGGLFASHPPTKERVADLTAEAKKFAVKDSWTTGEKEYRAALQPFWAKFIDDQIKLNDFGATEFLLGQLASNGWTSELLYARGELYRLRGKAGDIEKSAEYYRQAAKLPEALPETWRGLGIALMRMGKQADARRALRTYLERKPDAVDRAMISTMVVAR